MKKIKNNVVIITGPEFEDVEVIYPYYRLLAAGFSVNIATDNGQDIKGKFGVPISSLIKPNKPVSTTNLKIDDYDLVVIPGGHIAPDKIRQQQEVLDFIRDMKENNKLIVSICHGPWVLISAGILKGVRATCYPSMIDDLKNAGAIYLNEPVVVDKNIVTSRRPRDLPIWMEKTIEVFNTHSKNDKKNIRFRDR